MCSKIKFVLVFLTGSYFFSFPAQSQGIKMADSLFLATQYSRAIPLYEEALKEDANKKNAIAWNRLGFCYQNTKNYDQAEKNYLEAYKTGMPPAARNILYSRMSKVYSAKKDIRKSASWLDSAITVGYGDINDLETAEEFKNLRMDDSYKNLLKKVYTSAYPCSTDPKKREFDFWVGEWDVYNNTKILVGKSMIQKVTGECAIQENWSSLGSSYVGKSVNYYDAAKGKWHQFYYDSGSLLAPSDEGEYKEYTSFANPSYKGNAMVFKRKDADKKGEYIANFVFFNLESTKMRQFLEKSYDGGKTWVVGLDLLYVRK